MGNRRYFQSNDDRYRSSRKAKSKAGRAARPFHKWRRLGFESLESRTLLSADVGLSYQFTLNGTPVSSLTVGSSYVLNAYIRDNRTASATGILQAYFNVNYSSNLVSVPGGQGVTAGAEYDWEPSGDASTAGTINDAGGVNTFRVAPSPANSTLLLYSVPLIATSPGTLTLATGVVATSGNTVIQFFPHSDPSTVSNMGDVEVDGLTNPTLSADSSSVTGTIQVVAAAGSSTTTSVTASPSPSAFGQTATFTATVTPSSGTFDNGGTVQFAVDGVNFGSPVGLSSGKATIQDSALTVGTHTISASYGGDSSFAGSSGNVSGGQVVNKASTTTTVGSSANPSALSQAVTFTATVAAGSGSFDNGGTVQFAVDGVNFGSPVGVSGGKATIQDSVLTVGTHTISASYGGDPNFALSSGNISGGQVVSQASTTTSVNSSVNPSALGQSVTFTATVSPGAGTFDNGGTVQFKVDGANFGSPMALSGGQAAIQDAALAAGTHTIAAVYGGDTSFAGSSGNLSGGQVVNQTATTTTVSSSANPSTFGQFVTFTATVIPTSGTFDNGGTVQFKVDGVNFGSPISLSGGKATIQTSTLIVGTHTITATYGGDTNFAGGSGTLSGGQVVNQASTTTSVTSSSNPSSFGQSVTFTATVSPGSGTFDNGGTVQFLIDGANFGSPVSLSGGKATIQTSTLIVGTHTVTATYSGDTSFVGGSGTLAGGQVINQASTTTTVSSSGNPSAFGQSVIFTATVAAGSGTFDNGGTVQFLIDGASFGSPMSLSGGKATIQTSTLIVGTHTIKATYSGDTNFASGNGTLAGGQVVGQATTTTTVASSANPSAFGQSVTFTATVAAGSGTYDNGGTVQFKVDGANFGSPVSLTSGQAAIQDAVLAVGTHTVSASYSGDTSFAGSSGTVSGGQVVGQASTTTTVTSSVNPSAIGQSATFTATVSPGSGTFDNGGTVQFKIDGANVGSPVTISGGKATIQDAALAVGTHTITAAYAGDTSFAGSSGTLAGGQTVGQASTTTTVTSSVNPSALGQSVTFTATVTASAGTFDNGGTVQFKIDGANFGSPVSLSGGKAMVQDAALAVGTHTITATYAGDTTFAGSSGTLAAGQAVGQSSTSTTVSSSANPATFGQAVTFTATVASGLGTFDNGGTVQFAIDGANFGSPMSLTSGKATIQTSTLTVGTHTVTATYSGDTNFAAGSGTLSGGQVVNQASTTTAVSSSASPSTFGLSVTFTATVAASSGTFDNGGTVQFKVDGANFGSPVSLSGGKATIQTSALAVGTHTIAASYVGDTSFAGGSGTLGGGQVVNQASTTTTVISSANPSVIGQSATFTATVTPGSGTFDNGGTVQFKIDGANFGSPVSLSGGKATIQDAALSIGTHTVTAAYGGDTSFAGSSGTLAGGQVVNKAATTTTVSANPTSINSGQSVTLSVVVAAVAPGAGTPSGTVTFFDGSTPLGTRTLDAGSQATLATTLLATGSHTVTASYAGATNWIASSGTTGESVNSGAATHLVVSVPSSSTAGNTFTITVTAEDQNNNTATSYNGNVEFTSSDPAAVLPDATLSNGTATFSVTFKTAGSQTVTVADSSNGSIAGTSSAVVVGSAAATHFALAASSTHVAGTPFNITVTAKDPFNNTVTSYAGTVHFTSSDPAAVLPADSTLTSGTGTFSATMKTAGSQTLTATDTSNSSITATADDDVDPTITLSPPTPLPTGTEGTAYNQSITASGGNGATTLAVSNIQNPIAGLSVPASGINSLTIGGTPTASGTESFTVTATDSTNDSVQETYTLTIVGPPPTATVQTPGSVVSGNVTINFALIDAAQNPVNVLVEFSADAGATWLTATAAPNSPPTQNLASSSSPSGFAHQFVWASGANIFDAHNSNVLIRITPTDATTGAVGATVSTGIFSVNNNQFPRPVITSAPPSVQGGAQFSFTVSMEDSGGNPVTSADNVEFFSSDGSALVPGPGSYFSEQSTVTFSATLTTPGEQTLAVVDSVDGGGSSVSINVIGIASQLAFTTSPQTMTAGLASGTITVTLEDSFGNAVNASGPVTVALGTTSATGHFNPLSPVTIPQGSNHVSFTYTDTTVGSPTITASSNGLTSTMQTETVNPAVSLSPLTLPAGDNGVAYNQSISASGGTGSKALAVSNIQNAIPGLNVPVSGNNVLTIGGTPTATGTETFTVTATDSLGASTFTNYSITINTALASLSPATLPGGDVGIAYSKTITTSGGTTPYVLSVSSGTLPPGLMISTGGLISGTPTTVGTATFTVMATDAAGGTVSAPYSITINAALASLSPASLPAGDVGVAYSKTITANGGTSPYTFVVTSGTLPPGLALSTSGTVSGTPTTVGTSSFTVTATDATGAAISAPYSITINQALASLSPAALPAGDVGVLYSQSITANGGTGPYTFGVTAGTLPSGLTFSPSGLVSGVLTTVGTSNFTVTATDAAGGTLSAPYSITVNAALSSLNPAALPDGDVGVSYHQTITASGGTAPYTFAVTSGTLPPGLTLATGGVISGAPTTVGTSDFTVTGTDAAGGTISSPYSITVNAALSSLNPAALPGGDVGVAYSQTITASGGTASYTFALTAGTLPSGLTLSAGGVISGTPTTVGTSHFTVTATDAAGGTLSAPYSITISTALASLSPAALPAGDVGVSYSKSITANGGAAPFTFVVSSGTPPPGLSLSTGGVVSGTPTSVGTSSFTVMATDAAGGTISAPYSITINAALSALNPPTLPNGDVGVHYSQTITATGGTAPYTFAVTVGTVPAGLTLSSAGVLGGTPTTAGPSNFTVTATDAAGGTISLAYSVTIDGPLSALSPASLPAGDVGVAYSKTITAVGGTAPYTFAVTVGTLPPGLTLSTGGVVSGTPTTVGTSSFTVMATDAAGGTLSAPYSITINTALSALHPTSLPDGDIGANYSQTITATGGTAPYTFAVTAGTLPQGLTLSTGGVISGMPTAVGPTDFTITATDAAGGTLSAPYSITIDTGPTSISPASLPDGDVGVAYSKMLVANGGLAPFTYAVTSGTLPAGLALSAGGVISGTPTTVGTSDFTVTATDSAQAKVSAPYSITIHAALSSLSPAALPGGDVDVVYSQTITAIGGTAPSTFAVTVGTLPPGLTLSTGGVVSGMPTTVGTSHFTVTATDAAGGTISAPYSITVSAAMSSLSPATLPAGDVGVSYSKTITAVGGTGPYTFAVTVGTLPPGLTLSTVGAISGTPTTVGTSNFTVTATDAAGGTLAAPYSITINAAPASLSPASLPAGDVGISYSQTITASGGTVPFTFAVTTGTLPPGLSLSTSGGISGTPTTVGTSNFTITATDAAGGKLSGPYAITINAALSSLSPATLPGGDVGIAYSKTITAVGGTGPDTFAVTLGTLPPGLTLSTGGAVSGTPTAVGTSNFTVTATDAAGGTISAPYSIAISNPPSSVNPATLPGADVGLPYSQTFTGTGGTGPYTFDVDAGSLPPGLTLASGGMLSGTPTSVGTSNFTITLTDAAGAKLEQPYTVTTNPALSALSPATLPGGDVGLAYNQTITVTGGTSPTTFSVTSGTLPPGLTLSTGGGLTGTPTTAGPFNFTITATDSLGAKSSTPYSVKISPALSGINPATLPEGNVGVSYSQTITAVGGTGPNTFAVTSGALPPGLTLSSGGVLSGTPTTVGTTQFTITATDALGATVSNSYNFSVVLANSSLSGYVYADTNNSGQRQVSAGVFKTGLPDVAITLERTDASAPNQTVLTQVDGSYQFMQLPAGTYTIVETQPSQYLTGGKDTPGTPFGGTGSTSDTISQVVVTPAGKGTEYNFGEYLLAPGLLSKRIALASTPTTQSLLAQELLDPPPVVKLGASTTNNTTSSIGGSAVSIAPAATISYTAGYLASMTVSIANLKDGSAESLVIPGQTLGTPAQPQPLASPLSTNIVSAYSPSTGVLTLSGVATVAAYEQVLQSIEHQDTAASPDPSTRYVNVTVYDAVSGSNTATVTITDPPAPAVSSSSSIATSSASKPQAAAKKATSPVATSLSQPLSASAVDRALAGIYSWIM